MVISRAMWWVLAAGFAVFLAGQVTASAQPFLTLPVASAQAANSQLLPVAKKTPIDKSCLMVCERWGDDGCLKWVMKCKGNSANPKLQGSPRARE